jgi:hypothetical protein
MPAPTYTNRATMRRRSPLTSSNIHSVLFALCKKRCISRDCCKPTACQSNHDEHIVFVNPIVRPANGYDAGGVDSYSTALNDRVDYSRVTVLYST